MLTGKELKIKRVILDIKATDIANALGVHRSYISNMEKGIREIPKRRYTQWVSYLNEKEGSM